MKIGVITRSKANYYRSIALAMSKEAKHETRLGNWGYFLQFSIITLAQVGFYRSKLAELAGLFILYNWN